MPHKLAPAPGYTYRGIDGESNGTRMLVASGITLGLAILATILRMIVRLIIVPSTSLEDVLAIAALVLSAVRTGMLVHMTNDHQFGQHIWDIEKANFGFVYTWAKGATIIYLAAIACAKVSILLLYIRLFRINKLFRYTCYALMTLVIGYCTGMILATIFQCKPVRAGWEFFTPGNCRSLQDYAVVTGALNILSDIAIVIAPIPLVLKLKLRTVKMLGLLAVLATGFFVVAAAIVREVEVVGAPSHYDATWTDATRTLWLSVELNIGIICTSLPLLSPLGRKIPGKQYFKDQYQSMVSLLRGSRRSSPGSRSGGEQVQQQPGEENKNNYIELDEAEVGLHRDVDPMFLATVHG